MIDMTKLFSKTDVKGMLHRWAECMLVFIALGSFFPPTASAQDADRPNIIFIIGDDMERDTFNCLPEYAGKNLSPNLDRMAIEGVAFPNFHCANPACTPSRYNVLTGRYGSRDRSGSIENKINSYDMAIIGWNPKIMADDVTLPKLLKNAGYRTGFVGKDHVHDANVTNSKTLDPAIYHNPYHPDTIHLLTNNYAIVQTAIKACGFDYAESIFKSNAETFPTNNVDPTKSLAVHNMDWITKGGLDFLDDCVTNHSDKPFFLYFSTTLTHSPYPADRSWNADPLSTPAGFLTTAPNVQPARSTIMPRLIAAGISTNSADHKPHLLAFDDSVGAVFGKIEEHGLDDNTLVFFFNDHGVEAGKASCYEGGALAMSMAWKKDGFQNAIATNAYISNVDFAPTILDYAGVEVPFNQFDGKSFRPILDGNADAHRRVIFTEMGCVRGIQIENWKYMAVRYPTSIIDPVGNEVGQTTLRGRYAEKPANGLEIVSMDAHPDYFDFEQFYDLSVDPTEINNLAELPEHAERIAEMQTELEKFVNPLPGGFAEFKTTNNELHPGMVLELF
jgi:arylsulfatase A